MLSGVGIALSVVCFVQFAIGFFNEFGNGSKIRAKIDRFFVHFFTPSGFPILTIYFLFTYGCGKMHQSYYDTKIEVRGYIVFSALLLIDFLMYIIHRAEHALKSTLHHHHHVHQRPKWFHAFDAHVMDTVFLILVPLHATTSIFHFCMFEYILFGLLISTMFTLIHSEREVFFFDRFAKNLGLGTSHFHAQHHFYRNVNFGHIFEYWDLLFGTFKA
jgi:sterol desaturase/sphingolipid hydroxylase (fatty acid hydroxylase superfamily)